MSLAETPAGVPAWTEERVQNRLAAYLNSKPGICVPNCGAFDWEADVLRLTPSWIVSEYEIKVSRGDFLADKRKREKHLILSGVKASKKPRPNFFWYCTPPGLVTLADLPKHAGLLEIGNRWDRFTVVRRAPRIHAEPTNARVAVYMLRGLGLRYWQGRLTVLDRHG